MRKTLLRVPVAYVCLLCAAPQLRSVLRHWEKALVRQAGPFLCIALQH